MTNSKNKPDFFDDDDGPKTYTTNPNISQEDNDNYINKGQLPVIGVCMGPGGHSIKGRDVQRAAAMERERLNPTGGDKQKG